VKQKELLACQWYENLKPELRPSFIAAWLAGFESAKTLCEAHARTWYRELESGCFKFIGEDEIIIHSGSEGEKK
jgi:hypothetical protein